MTTLCWPRPSAAMGRHPKPQGFQGMPATLQCCQLGRKVGESSDSPTVPTLRHYRSGYPNECMTGFEWQVAAHMICEGIGEEGLAIGKAIHDRYSQSLHRD